MRSRLPPWAVAGLFPWLLAGNATVAAWAQSPSNAPNALATVDVRGVPAVSSTRRYVYDAHHRLCKVIEPETGATVIGYDAAGNESWRAAGLDLPSTTSCDHTAAGESGRAIARSFDARNRLSILAFPDGRGNQVWTYTPDGLPATITTWNDPGTEPVVDSYLYNARRALTEETTRRGGFVSTIRHAYDGNGHRTLTVAPDGLEVRSDVDALGRPLRVYSGWGKSFASDVRYHPNGAIKQFTYGNGIVHALTQNARQLPERSTDSHGGRAVLDDSYDFDANGNVVAITDGATGRNQRGNRTMAYDGLDRLVTTHSPMFGTARYAYDAVDRLTRVQVTGGSAARDHAYCHDASHRLTNVKTGGCGGASVVGLGYDAQGNVVNKNGQAFDFDYGNRLRAATGKERYAYDGHGRRVAAFDAAGVPIRSHYDASGRLIYQQDERKTLNVPHIYLGDRLIARFEWNGTTHTTETRYQHLDQLGSPVVVTDDGGNVVERSEYEPYGRLVNRQVADGVGYAGHVVDSTTGNVNMQDRYMDPDLGVFLSTDAATAYATGDWRFFARYGYAFNNPYRFVDPDGRQSREFNFENQRLGIRPPTRSEKDWLGPLIAYGLVGIVAAPAVGFVATSGTGTTVMAGASDLLAGEALGGATLGAGAAIPLKLTAEQVRKALAGSSLGTLQDSISLPMVQRYVDALFSGSPAPAIRVADGIIIDGNHRYAAGRVTGQTPDEWPGVLPPSQIDQVRPVNSLKIQEQDFER